MSITVEKKQELITSFALSPSDTGSVDVQCSVLTERIRNLTEHCKIHKHDHSTKLGLLKLVNRRKSLLRYLTNSNQTSRYKTLIAKLGIRK
jgi:small subunit ribosomal protein S15